MYTVLIYVCIYYINTLLAGKVMGFWFYKSLYGLYTYIWFFWILGYLIKLVFSFFFFSLCIWSFELYLILWVFPHIYIMIVDLWLGLYSIYSFLVIVGFGLLDFMEEQLQYSAICWCLECSNITDSNHNGVQNFEVDISECGMQLT